MAPIYTRYGLQNNVLQIADEMGHHNIGALLGRDAALASQGAAGSPDTAAGRLRRQSPRSDDPRAAQPVESLALVSVVSIELELTAPSSPASIPSA